MTAVAIVDSFIQSSVNLNGLIDWVDHRERVTSLLACGSFLVLACTCCCVVAHVVVVCVAVCVWCALGFVAMLRG
jgi:hypothetical protein